MLILNYLSLNKNELLQLRSELQEAYDSFKAKGLTLNMARGKPCTEQLELSMPMLEILHSKAPMTTSTGEDCRNYGLSDGLPEMKSLFAQMLDVDPENVIVGGNSSLNMMFDTISCAVTHGFAGCKPWGKQESIKFICPSPGYDRHFAISQYF